MNDILFDPVLVAGVDSSRSDTAAKVSQPRYYFESDEIEIAIVADCDCEQCYTDQCEGDFLPGWSIYDRKCGHKAPIAFCEDATEAQKIVNALNSRVG